MGLAMILLMLTGAFLRGTDHRLCHCVHLEVADRWVAMACWKNRGEGTLRPALRGTDSMLGRYGCYHGQIRFYSMFTCKRLPLGIPNGHGKQQLQCLQVDVHVVLEMVYRL